MTLKKYIIKRLILSPFILFVSITLVFILVHLAPGDPISVILGMQPGVHYNPSDIARIKHLYGLDRPLYEQYFSWLVDLLKGNWGTSYFYNVSVLELIGRRIGNTLILQSLAFVISMSISIPAAIVSAVKQYSKIDYLTTIMTVFFWSLPSFWYGIIMIQIFSGSLGLFPSSGIGVPGVTPTLIDLLWHLFLPAVVLGTAGTAFMARITRSAMLEVLRQDYVTAARAKGLRERVVIYKHALRNALLPVTTLMAVYVGWLLSGSAIVETVFAWPGIGSLIVDAAKYRDYPTVTGVTLIATMSMVVAMLVVDISYAYLDPRIRY